MPEPLERNLRVDFILGLLPLTDEQRPWFIDAINMYFGSPSYFADAAAELNLEFSQHACDEALRPDWKHESRYKQHVEGSQLTAGLESLGQLAVVLRLRAFRASA